jgi:CBS domain-containing protein
MEKNVITIESEKSCLEGAKILEEKDISFLVILKDGIPAGIVTERDFLRKLVLKEKNPHQTPLSEIMSPKFRSVEPGTEIEEAVQKMFNNNIRRLVVLEDGKLAGVITQTDLTEFLRSKILIGDTMKNLELKS